MAYFLGYYLGNFLIVWGIYILATKSKVKKMNDEEEIKKFKKKRLINSLIIAIFVAMVVYGMNM